MLCFIFVRLLVNLNLTPFSVRITLLPHQPTERYWPERYPDDRELRATLAE